MPSIPRQIQWNQKVTFVGIKYHYISEVIIGRNAWLVFFSCKTLFFSFRIWSWCCVWLVHSWNGLFHAKPHDWCCWSVCQGNPQRHEVPCSVIRKKFWRCGPHVFWNWMPSRICKSYVIIVFWYENVILCCYLSQNRWSAQWCHSVHEYPNHLHILFLMLIFLKGIILLLIRGTKASCLVHLPLDQVDGILTLAGNNVLCSWARHLTLTVPLSFCCKNGFLAKLMLD